ncbi:dicarboxylate/amino acid:cation symporter [Tundrisphaera sp. TA3]|uniref:dicarboxylate/amino acid:cation symporter n=1 Tax=Tundrisphaera sp. TA3 TaxID=3435775 RepID=UPI003EBFEDDC
MTSQPAEPSSADRDARSRLPRIPVVARILIGIALGVLAGEILGDRAAPLARIGTTILDVVKGLAGPLLFFAVLDAFLRTRIRGRDARTMVAISAINATIAVVIGLTLSNVFQPGKSFHLARSSASAAVSSEFRSMRSQIAPDRSIDFTRELLSYIPTSLVRPFVENSIITIVILAVLGGAALRVVKDEQIRNDEDGYRSLENSIVAIYRGLEIALGWIVALIPLAVFGVVAKAVGSHGFRSFGGLIPYVAIGIIGLLIQNLIVYQGWMIFVAKISPRKFWMGGREALATAIGTGSSLATLPVTLRALDRMGVSARSARLAACVGTNLNNDGILLYEAMAVLFVAQAIGVEMPLGQQVVASIACIFAGIGISGVPDAGLISLLLVLKTVQLPEAEVNNVVPFLLAVDWILGRCRSTTNVASDLLVAVLLDRTRSTVPSLEDQAEEDSDPSGI